MSSALLLYFAKFLVTARWAVLFGPFTTKIWSVLRTVVSRSTYVRTTQTVMTARAKGRRENEPKTMIQFGSQRKPKRTLQVQGLRLNPTSSILHSLGEATPYSLAFALLLIFSRITKTACRNPICSQLFLLTSYFLPYLLLQL